MTRAEELVASFDIFTGTYKREEMEEALTLQEEITPLLLNIFEEIIADPEVYADEAHHAETYAVALLAHFRETRAHLPIIRAFSIPDEERDYIWGDMLTETLPALLCRTSGGDYTHILELARDRNAYEFLRSSALEALKFGIACGDLSRREGLDHFATFFDETLAEPGDHFWAALICDLMDLYPIELEDNIRELFAKDLVYEGDVGLEDLERALAKGLDTAMIDLNQQLERRLPEDVHKYLSWFACFRERQPVADSTPQTLLLKSAEKKKEKARGKRKQAKQSKRKNRR